MGISITYPDGTTLVSSAWTLQQIEGIVQPLVCGMLGIGDSVNTSLVRVKYPVQGQPYQQITDDICYITCLPREDPYTRIRDKFNWGPNGWGDEQFGQEPYGGTLSGDPALTEQWNYTNAWAIHFTFYGPNSYDRARAVRSAFYQDYFTAQFALSQLFPVSDYPTLVRVPEEINGQWIERVDFDVECYEFVTETINRQTVLSEEVILQNSTGVIDDFTVSVPD